MNDVRVKMSPEGAIWMGEVATCLQQKVQAIPPSTSCQETGDEAIASHPACYLGTGYCTLPFSDRLLLAETIWESFGDPRIERVMLEIIGGCAERGDPIF